MEVGPSCPFGFGPTFGAEIYPFVNAQSPQVTWDGDWVAAGDVIFQYTGYTTGLLSAVHTLTPWKILTPGVNKAFAAYTLCSILWSRLRHHGVIGGR